MTPTCCHDREKLAEFLRQDPLLYLYLLGDLDDFFWPYTTWYTREKSGRIRQAVLLYSGMELPTLHALHAGQEGEPASGVDELLHGILPLLPAHFYAHLAGDLPDVLAAKYEITPHGEHHRMGLADPSALSSVDTASVLRLEAGDLEELRALYAQSYPGNWFDPRMLETGFYFGLRREGRLASVAGIHVYSPQYKVAALGNVTTHPAWRGQGLASVVCARLCLALLETVEHVGLNVKADNRVAIACYERLGFRRVASYGEYTAAHR